MAPVTTYHQGDLAAIRGESGIEWVTPQEAANRIAGGLAAPVTRDDVFRSYYRDDPVAAGMMGLARGATIGLSDLGYAAAFGGDTVKEYREENPAASLAGEVVGMLGSAAIPGGPLAQLGRGAKAAVTATKLATKSPGAARVATAALEGAGVAGAFGATQAAIDPDKTAADVLKDVAAGAALGGGFSLAGLGIARLGRLVGEKLGGRARKALERQESLQAELSTLRKQHGLVDAELKAELGVEQAPILDEIARVKQQLDDATRAARGAKAAPVVKDLTEAEVSRLSVTERKLKDKIANLTARKNKVERRLAGPGVQPERTAEEINEELLALSKRRNEVARQLSALKKKRNAIKSDDPERESKIGAITEEETPLGLENDKLFAKINERLRPELRAARAYERAVKKGPPSPETAATLERQHAELLSELRTVEREADEIAKQLGGKPTRAATDAAEAETARLRASAASERDRLREQLSDLQKTVSAGKESLNREAIELREQLQRRIDDVRAQLAPTTTGMLGKVGRYIMNRKLAHAVASPLGGGVVGGAVGWTAAPALTARISGGMRPTIGTSATAVAKRAGGMLGRAGRAVRLPFYKLSADGVRQLRADLDATDLGQLRAELMAGMPSDVSEGAAQEAVEETVKGLAFLKKAAWSPGPTALGEDPKPSARQVEATSAVARAAVDPDSVLEDLANLTLTEEGLSTLEALYPNQLDLMRQRLKPLLGARKDYSLREISQLSLFFRDPTLVTLFMDPALGVYMQDTLEQQKKQRGRPRRRSIKAHEREATRLERAQEK